MDIKKKDLERGKVTEHRETHEEQNTGRTGFGTATRNILLYVTRIKDCAYAKSVCLC
jgi:hypothetical protein